MQGRGPCWASSSFLLPDCGSSVASSLMMLPCNLKIVCLQTVSPQALPFLSGFRSRFVTAARMTDMGTSTITRGVPKAFVVEKLG